MPQNAANTWFILKNGKPIGPLQAAEVRRLIKNGVVTAATPACRKLGDPWTPIRDLIRTSTEQPHPTTATGERPPGNPMGGDSEFVSAATTHRLMMKAVGAWIAFIGLYLTIETVIATTSGRDYLANDGRPSGFDLVLGLLELTIRIGVVALAFQVCRRLPTGSALATGLMMGLALATTLIPIALLFKLPNFLIGISYLLSVVLLVLFDRTCQRLFRRAGFSVGLTGVPKRELTLASTNVAQTARSRAPRSWTRGEVLTGLTLIAFVAIFGALISISAITELEGKPKQVSADGGVFTSPDLDLTVPIGWVTLSAPFSLDEVSLKMPQFEPDRLARFLAEIATQGQNTKMVALDGASLGQPFVANFMIVVADVGDGMENEDLGSQSVVAELQSRLRETYDWDTCAPMRLGAQQAWFMRISGTLRGTGLYSVAYFTILNGRRYNFTCVPQPELGRSAPVIGRFDALMAGIRIKSNS